MSTTNEAPASRVKAKDIAAHYKVAERTVYKWKDDGLIPFIKIGKSVRFDMQAVVEAIEGKPS